MNVEPAWMTRARQELGVHETPGPFSTPRILQYRKMSGVSLPGDDGVVPWCAIFVGAMLAQVGIKGTGNGMARGYLHWGKNCQLAPGAVCVISSDRGPTSGHVFFATGRHTATHVEGLGGNQGDAVTLAWWPIARVLGYRWPAELQPPVGQAVLIGAAAPAKEVSDA